jgi:hypothetical protein
MFPARSALKFEVSRRRIASFHSDSDCARIMRKNCWPARLSPSPASRTT